MTAELVGAAQAVGLDHQLGFLHGLRPGRPSLALDLLEEFRSGIVDRFVVGAVGRRQLRIEHFEQLPGGAVYLSTEGRAEYFRLFEEFRDGAVRHELLDKDIPRWALAVTQMTILARHLRGDWEYVPWLVSSRSTG
jgi:CRISPR-associated protein Cas1